MDRHVWIPITFSAGFSFSLGVWGMAILGPYLFALTNSNSAVGWAEGLQGACLALTAIPAGVLADKHPLWRTTIIKFAGVLGFGSVGVTLLALYLQSFYIMCGALSLWGCFQGAWSPALTSLLADAIPQGGRSRIFMFQYALSVLATAAGPLLTLALFQLKHVHSWSIEALSTVFAVGVIIILPFTALLFLLPSKPPQQQPQENKHIQQDDISIPIQKQGHQYSLCRLTIGPNAIPALVAISDLIAGLASGMTVKFFSLFFKNEVGLSPLTVSLIYVISPAMIAFFAWLEQKLSQKLGRIQISAVSMLFGVSLLVCMSWNVLWALPAVLVPVFLLRTSLMNAPNPLIRSVLMDFTTQEMRAKWSSLESVTSFGWSGSAVLGGILADKVGYGHTFLITAAMQFVSLSVLSLTMPVVQLERQQETVDYEATAPLLDEVEEF